jgi:AcrR family transcriptional regulator
MRRSTVFVPPRLAPAAPSRRAEQLLDELEEIFLAEGFHHLSIAELATRLRTSRRTFYELAPSRDELVLVVLDRILHRAGRQAHDQLDGIEDPLDRIEVFLAGTLPELRRMSVRFSEDLQRQPSAQRLYTDHLRYATGLVEQMVQEAIDVGRARAFDPYFVSQALDAIAERINEPDYRRASGMSVEETGQEVLRFFRAALEIPGTSNGPKPRPTRRRAAPTLVG